MRSEDSAPSSSIDSAVRRLDDLITSYLPGLALEGKEPPEFIPPTPPITPDEAQGFLRAIKAGIFDIGDDGKCWPRGLRPSTGYCYPLLERRNKSKNEVRLWREWLTHAAAAEILHVHYGYPLHDIALDVDALDVLVYSPLNQPLIAVEVKKSSRELDAMLNEMRKLEQEPFDITHHAPLSNAKKKFRSLLALRPVFFLALAPGGVKRAYAVRHPDDPSVPTVELMEIPDVPRASSLGR